MSEATSTWWGVAVGALLVGTPMLIWGDRIAHWNRRVGRKGPWRVPAEDDAASTWWGGRYLRTVGAVCAAVGVAVLVITVLSS